MGESQAVREFKNYVIDSLDSRAKMLLEAVIAPCFVELHPPAPSMTLDASRGYSESYKERLERKLDKDRTKKWLAKRKAGTR